ncbi:MAG: TraB/GumN family protein [Pseudomonadaceae bacterium]|nr:TraB/GumN family protein [Pseudomonadaceae bacterium]
MNNTANSHSFSPAANQATSRWRLLAASVLSVLLAGVAHGEFDQAAYDSLTGSRAVAKLSSPGSEPTFVTVGSQINDLLASGQAMQQCQATAKAQAVAEAPAATCELVRVGADSISTGAELRARVPAGEHPLFLWRYSKGGATVYLAGTIHLLKQSLYPLPTQLQAAFDQSDHLVVEVNAQAIPPQQLQLKSLQHSMLPDGMSLESLLDKPLLDATRDSLTDLGLNMAMVATMKPSAVATQLAVMRMLAYGYNPANGIESHFLAQVGDRQILELETFEQQLTLLFGAPLDVQVEMLKETLAQQEDTNEMLSDMIVAWMSGDDEGLANLFNTEEEMSQGARDYQQSLLGDRNKGMAAKIQGYLDSGSGTYMVLVGSAHLAGDGSIVELLTEADLQGERLTSRSVL